MEPLDLPAIIGGTVADGVNDPPSAAVIAVGQSAAADLDAAEAGIAEFVNWLSEEADKSMCQTDECSDASIWQYAESAISDLNKSEKNITPFLDELFSLASDDLDRSHRAIESVGGRPMIMTDESYGANQGGSHFAEAMERIIFPAIAQQEQQAVAGTTSVEPPPFPGEPTDANPTREPPIPIPGIQDPPARVPVEVPPGEPVDPGEPVEPPTVPTSPTPPVGEPGGGQCCPVQPPPVVNVKVVLPPGHGIVPSGSGGPSEQQCPVPPPYKEPEDPWTDIPYLPPEPSSPAPPVVPPVYGGTVPPVVYDPIVQAKAGSFDGPAFCDLVSRCKDKDPGNGSDEKFFRFLADVVGGVVSQIPFLREAAGGIRNHIEQSLRNLKTAVGVSSARNGIADPSCLIPGMMSTFFPKLLEKYTGVDLSYGLEPQMQIIRHSSPVHIPPQGAIDAAFLSNKITQTEWECHTKALGNLPQIHYRTMLAGSRQMQINEAVLMRRRGIIGETEYRALLRDDGVLEGRVGDLLLRLTDYVPTPQEIFMWLSKDVSNQAYVNIAKLDEGFEESWNPTFQKWADANGLTKEQIMYEYRAQWKLPSKTQVDEFIRRLRPGRVDPALAFTKDDAKLLYKLDEVPEGFRDRLIETSYVPINRTDIMAAYISGSMPKAEVFERFQDIGYSPKDALALTEFVEVKSEQQTQGSMGAWTRRRITTEYVQGSIPRLDAEELLGRTVKDPLRIRDALDDADRIRSAISRKQCIKAVKKRFLYGEFGEMTARNRLTNLGLDQVQANTIIDGWVCELNSKHKEPTVKMLTDWAKNGLITVPDLRGRLLNLGYTADDATRIINMAAIQQAEKAVKAARPRK